MKLSYYVKAFPYDEKPGYLILFSTRRLSKILLNEETFNAIINGTLLPESEAALSRLGMLVPDIEAEKKEVLGLIETVNAENPVLNISLIVNLACNFNCVYCYEGGMKGKYFMTDETAGLLPDFIKNNISSNKKTVNIDFYGGEPLLSVGLIKSISAKIKSVAKSRGVKYTFTLVTNGSLFSRRIAEDLSRLGLYGIKTTIDGPPEIHNISRPFISGSGSFDVIIKNIQETCDVVKIGVGGNYQKGNYKSFPLLFNHFEKAGLSPDKIYEINFYPVMKNPSDISSSVDFTDGFMSINEQWAAAASTFLREKVLESGYRTAKITPSLCQMEVNDSYVVNYDGSIFKCPSFIGREKFEIGNLRQGVTDYSHSLKNGIWKKGECPECEYLPICFGGCRYMTYVKDGNIESVDCNRPTYDAILETLIKQDIRYRDRWDSIR